MIQCKVEIPYDPNKKYVDQIGFAWVDTAWEDHYDINMLSRQYQTEFRRIQIIETLE